MESLDKCGIESQTLTSNVDRVQSEWPQDSIVDPNPNSTLLYIAVEYVKDEFKEANSTMACDNFMNLQHVNSYDPNMNSIANYSPIYNDQTSINPVVIHQLVSSDSIAENSTFVNSTNSEPTLDSIPAVLYDTAFHNVDVDGQYIQLENDASVTSVQNLSDVSKEQGVEILITDHSTGISYSVNTQQLLVEQEELLESLSPGPLLDSDLLTIDDSMLKNNLPEHLIQTEDSLPVDVDNTISNYMLDFSDNKIEFENDEGSAKLRKKTLPNELESEDKLLSKVFNIVDKPILSRARASLPETYLRITKIDEDWAVFAKKCIRKRTQFGPVQGVLKNKEEIIRHQKRLELFLKNMENDTLGLDTSDEEQSNWMCFVRKAESYEEQNLVVSEQDNCLYFTVVRNIMPKEELKVGYSLNYANLYNLPLLVKKPEDLWPCFECNKEFPSSKELQDHLNVHEDGTEPERSKRKNSSSKKKLNRVVMTEAWQCKICGKIFNPPKFSALKLHLVVKHHGSDEYVEDNFILLRNYKCQKCDLVFHTEDLFKCHSLIHNDSLNNSETENMGGHFCTSCDSKFPSKMDLIRHVGTHALPKFKIIPERFQCPICYTSYPLRERLQKHMLIHGPEDSKPLQCDKCKKRFMNSSALICHLKTHVTGESIYECPICKDRFDHVPELKSHVQKHCVNSTYTCPHCNKKFRAYSIIRKHIRAFHGEQKHVCQHCSKNFPTMDKLKIHLLKYSENREFLCSHCGKQFKRKDKLQEHCKRVHTEERENSRPKGNEENDSKKNVAKAEPTDFHRYIYKCHPCLIGFKRRGMLVNHLAKRHPDISLDSVPELNLPILRATKDYFCQYCDKVYKSSSKRKIHILKNHPGAGLPNVSFSQTVGSVTTSPQNCKWCHKQYASKAKLLHHQRKEHVGNLIENDNDADRSDKELNAGDLRGNEDREFPIFKQSDFEVTDKVFEANVSEEFVDDPEPDGNFNDLDNLASNDVFNQTDAFVLPNSHLYRLLTNANNLVPPR